MVQQFRLNGSDPGRGSAAQRDGFDCSRAGRFAGRHAVLHAGMRRAAGGAVHCGFVPADERQRHDFTGDQSAAAAGRERGFDGGGVERGRERLTLHRGAAGLPRREYGIGRASGADRAKEYQTAVRDGADGRADCAAAGAGEAGRLRTFHLRSGFCSAVFADQRERAFDAAAAAAAGDSGSEKRDAEPVVRAAARAISHRGRSRISGCCIR